MTEKAQAALLLDGARLQPIPGGNPPYFTGRELYVPPSEFPLFNALRADRQIEMLPTFDTPQAS